MGLRLIGAGADNAIINGQEPTAGKFATVGSTITVVFASVPSVQIRSLAAAAAALVVLAIAVIVLITRSINRRARRRITQLLIIARTQSPSVTTVPSNLNTPDLTITVVAESGVAEVASREAL